MLPLRPEDVRIPGYRIQRSIGHGGMATVFLAEQVSRGREVALKVMPSAAAADLAIAWHLGRDSGSRRVQENLVQVYDAGMHGSLSYLATEYLPGGTLRDRLRAGLRVEDALAVACAVARALVVVHARGFVHRDVKPANILFRADGTAVLADFGIAQASDVAERAQGGSGTSTGTPDYMSPEHLHGGPVDARSDLYSLGVVLFEMLEGRLPYGAGDPFTAGLKHASQPLPQLAPPRAWLQPLVDALMAKSVESRIASAASLLQMVDTLLAASPQAASIASVRQGLRGDDVGSLQSAVQGRIGWWLAGLGLAALFAAGWWWFG